MNSVNSADSGIYSFAPVPLLGRSVATQVESVNKLDIPDAAQLKIELAAKDDSPQKRSILRSIKEFASLGSLLRLTGTASMILALGFFLLDGLQSAADHQHRFWILLGFSTITAISGIVISRLFQDQKGARLLVSVALISVPVCFAVLGALIYSVFPLDGLSGDYPGYLLWQASDVFQLTLAAAVCTAVAVVVGFLGFSVIARQFRVPIFISLMSTSLLLVVPVRESLWAVLVAVAMLVIAVTVFLRYIKPHLTVTTGWSAFAISLSALPFILVIARGIWLYEMPVTGMLAAVTIAHFLLVKSGRRFDGRLRLAAEIGSIVSAIAVVIFAIQFLWFVDTAWRQFYKHYDMLMLASLLNMLFLQLDYFISNRYVARACRILYSSAWLTTLMAGTLLLNIPHYLTVMALLLLFATFVYGLFRSYTSLSIAAALGMLLVGLRHQDEILNIVSSGGILSVVGFGVICVVTAHMLEKHGPVLKARFSRKKAMSQQV